MSIQIFNNQFYFAFSFFFLSERLFSPIKNKHFFLEVINIYYNNVYLEEIHHTNIVYLYQI
jgi:hypothetical protein